jgi:exodeoxyribonuclease VII large subunit
MERKPARVSQVNAYIKRILQSDPVLGDLSVIGEISNLKYHGSGHVYFTLKDAGGRLNCFLPAETLAKLRYTLADSMEVIASGYISLYEKGGYYSLNVRGVELAGRGDLAIAFEKLKEKLAGEDLFDDRHKKALPFFPEAIAVVTSDTGAALQDVLKIVRARNDVVQVFVCPVRVQGDGAAAEIADAIDALNRRHPEIGCMIVGRGGGSMEELWAFNEERVARSIFASKIPVISAVGHETDFTIADFVADRRAETPTAAAQMAVPETARLRELLRLHKTGLSEQMNRRLEHLRLRVQGSGRETMTAALVRRTERGAWRADALKEEMGRVLDARFRSAEAKTAALKAGLDSLNPAAVLERGYAILAAEDGRLIASARGVQANDRLTATLRDGALDLEVLRQRPAGAGHT